MTSTAPSFTIPARPDAAIACDMTDAPDTPSERLAEYGRLFAHALLTRERTPAGVVFTFAAKPGVWEWLTDLVHREAVCCPCFAYEVSADDNRIVWSLTSEAGPAAQAMLDEFAAMPPEFGDAFTRLDS